MNELSYKPVTDDRELQGAFEVRRQVFVEEQGVSEDEEYDDCDSEALHIVAKEGDRVIGTARVQFLADNHAKITPNVWLLDFTNHAASRSMARPSWKSVSNILKCKNELNKLKYLEVLDNELAGA